MQAARSIVPWTPVGVLLVLCVLARAFLPGAALAPTLAVLVLAAAGLGPRLGAPLVAALSSMLLVHARYLGAARALDADWTLAAGLLAVWVAAVVPWSRALQAPQPALLGMQRSEAVRGRDEVTRKILQVATDAVITIDGGGVITGWNPQAERVFGWPQGEALGRELAELVIPEHLRVAHRSALRRCVDTGESRILNRAVEMLAQDRGGRQFPIEIAICAIPIAGEPGFCAFVRDITQRKREETRFRGAVEAAPVAMILVRSSGEIAYANSLTEKLFGYTSSELVGLSVDRLVPDSARDGHPSLRSGFFQCPEARQMGAGRDLYARRKDGSEFPVEIGLNPLETDEGMFVLGAIVDISGRKRLEQRFATTVESAPTAMVMIDSSGSIVLVNAQTERLFGYAREEILGSSIEKLVPERFQPDHPTLRMRYFKQPVARAMGAGRDLYGRRKDGSEFPVEIGLNPVETEEGLFVLSAVVDISERKQLEESQRRLNEELEERVAERTAQLGRANEALERSNMELQQFAYIASHDLQTPLRTISGFVQLLERTYRDRLDEQALEWIEYTVAGTRQMQALISDLLAYSRVETRAQPFELTDLNDVFLESLAMLDASIQDTGATVTAEGRLPVIVGDHSQLLQLFTNLIGNGIKYHAEEPPRVRIWAVRVDDVWNVSVEDNGIGIEDQYHERVFEIFKRLHSAHEYPGTGIGLAVCRRVVQRHGGDIWVENARPRGSIFRFTLPERAAAPV